QVIENGLEVNPWGYNLYELGVDNISEIQTLDIQFYNSDSGGQCGVYFDYLWLEVKTNSPRPDLVLNGSGDFGWTVANAGDVNNDDIDDLLIGAPDTSGSTPGYAYIKYGNHQGFDNETTGSSPAGWTQYGVLTAKINDTVAYGGTGKSLDFIDMDDPDNIEIRKTFPQSYKGIIEFYARTWNDFETNLQFELSNGAATTEANRSVYIYFGKSTGQSSSINYYSGIDGSNNAVIRIGEYEQDPWYHFKIIFDCETDTFEVYIDDVLNGINSNFIWTNDHDYLDTFTIKSNFVFGSTRGYVDNIVWLGSPPDISLSGAVNGDRFGYSVANAGDLGGDGFDDVVIGAPYNDSAIGNIADAGAAYIFYGNSSMGDAQANNADNISYGKTANDHFGWSVSKANNIDGDNLLEIMVGAPHFNDGAKTDAGKVYVLTAGFVIPEFFNLAIPLFIILIFIAILKSKAKKNKKIKVGELNEK
ncbi:MAG: FG-GAP repeat protein, partial [Thermoplasmata archaeon]|nr:FG-GAP repeat protein [Thermoplasmata archaeon]